VNVLTCLYSVFCHTNPYIYLCVESNSLAANNEATNIEDRLHIMFQASNTFHHIVSDIIISQNIAGYNLLLYYRHRRTHTNIDEQLTSPLRQRFDVTSPRLACPELSALRLYTFLPFLDTRRNVT